MTSSSHLPQLARQEADRVAAHIDKALGYLREGDTTNAELCLIDAASLCEVELARAIGSATWQKAPRSAFADSLDSLDEPEGSGPFGF